LEDALNTATGLSYMNNNKSSLINFLKTLKGKNLKIVTAAQFFYETSNFEFLDDSSITFTDRLGNNVMLCLSEIAQVMEVNR